MCQGCDAAGCPAGTARPRDHARMGAMSSARERESGVVTAASASRPSADKVPRRHRRRTARQRPLPRSPRRRTLRWQPRPRSGRTNRGHDGDGADAAPTHAAAPRGEVDEERSSNRLIVDPSHQQRMVRSDQRREVVRCCHRRHLRRRADPALAWTRARRSARSLVRRPGRPHRISIVGWPGRGDVRVGARARGIPSQLDPGRAETGRPGAGARTGPPRVRALAARRPRVGPDGPAAGAVPTSSTSRRPDRWCWAGNSMGGATAMLQAAVEPDSVAGLVLTGSVYPWVRGAAGRTRWSITGSRPTTSPRWAIGSWMRGSGTSSAERLVRTELPHVHRRPFDIPPEVDAASVDAGRRNGPTTPRRRARVPGRLAVHAPARQAARRRAASDGRRSRARCSSCTDAAIAWCRRPSPRQPCETHPSWRGRIFPDLGHLPQMEAPGRWLAEVADWFAKRWPR